MKQLYPYLTAVIMLICSSNAFSQSAAEIKSMNKAELQQAKARAIENEDYSLAAQIKEELASRKSVDEMIAEKESELKTAVDEADYEKAAIIKDEILSLKKIKEIDHQIAEAVKAEDYAKAQQLKEIKQTMLSSLGSETDNNQMQTQNETEAQEQSQQMGAMNTIMTSAKQAENDHSAETEKSQSAVSQADQTTNNTASTLVQDKQVERKLNTLYPHLNSFNYNFVGLSLRFGGGFFMEGKEWRWKLTDKLVLGEYIGVMFTTEDMIPTIGLEPTYIYDYGARFVPYTGVALSMSMVPTYEYNSTTDELEKVYEFPIGGHLRGGAIFFFNDQKSSGFYTDFLVGFSGGVDFRLGYVFRYGK